MCSKEMNRIVSLLKSNLQTAIVNYLFFIRQFYTKKFPGNSQTTSFICLEKSFTMNCVIHIISIFIVYGLFSLFTTATGQTVLINEINFNPDDKNGNSMYVESPPCKKMDAREFIELYNPSPCDSVDIGCWIVGGTMNARKKTSTFVSCYDDNGTVIELKDEGWFTIPPGTMIPPLGFITVGGSESSNIDYVLANYGPANSSTFCGSKRFFLNSTSGWVALFKPDLTIADGQYWTQNSQSEYNSDTTFFDQYTNNCGCTSPLTMPSGRELIRLNKLTFLGNTNYDQSGQGPNKMNLFHRVPDGGCWKNILGSGSPKACNGECWKIPNPPQVREKSGRKIFCQGEILTFEVDFPKPQKECGNEVRYEWSSNPPTSPSATGQTYRVTAAVGTKYRLKIIFNNCEFVMDSFLVSIVDKPVPKFALSSPEVCEREKVEIFYTGDEVDSLNYVWTFEGGIPSTANGKGPHNVKWNTTGNKRVTIKVDLNGGCSSTFSDFIQVKSSPKGTPKVFTSEICTYDTTVITVEGLAKTSTVFDWNFDNGIAIPYSGRPNTFKVFWKEEGLKSVTMKIRDSLLTCISTADTLKIIVHPIPIARFTYYIPPTGICESVNLRFSGQADGSAVFHWFVQEGEKIIRKDGKVTYSKELEGEGDHEIRWSTPGYKIIGLYVTQFGCTSEVYTKTLRYNPNTTAILEMNVPNAFSPNGDHLNDEYELPYYTDDCCKYQMEIFDRWGVKIFTLPDDGLKWDGKQNGNYVSEGAYPYVLKIKTYQGPDVQHVGTITVIR